ncbi:TlpA disulfide reductase family protein [Flavobacterium sp.]|uniref:TlpA disulfide reductase family protein n=1 Tax=Flavobacterium sp. TaxID=239 RepID=UPI002609F252|nr:TlpA disulfide reductase family protein [Flavobacterium sp.]
MKKIVFLIALSLSILSCSKVKKGEFLISGEAKGLPNGKMIFLKTQNDVGLVLNVDSAKVQDGKFELKGKVKEPSMFALYIKDIQQPVPFIMESGEIVVKIDKDSIWKSKISGTESNDSFQEFNDKSNAIQKRMVDYQNKNIQKLMEAQQKKDNITIESLKSGYVKIQKEMDDYMNQYPDENPNSYISLLLVERLFSSQDFKYEKVKKTFENLNEKFRNTTKGKAISDKLKTIEKNMKNPAAAEKLNSLKLAPDFSAKSPNGKTISLKESLGKVTIIDFWASWCGPCRKENPNVVALYNEFHSKGLNIIGVSLDDEATKWKEAIAKDKLTWNQVSNLKGFEDPIATLYDVQQIPTTFVLDSKGNIVAKDLSGDELKAKVQELLAQ